MVAKALERPTLVLNRNWQPVNVATVARALVLLWNESARVVDPYTIYVERKGKISIRSYGNIRPHASKTSKTAKPASAAKSTARPAAKKTVPMKKTAPRKST